MVIEKLHGLQATTMSLNDRFTLLASTVVPFVSKPRRRSSGTFSQGQFNNQTLIEQVAQRFGQNARKQAVRQRIGVPGLRRFGSEGSLAGLQRSNSYSNLNQYSVKKRIAWRQSNGNLSRSASFNNLSRSVWRGRGFRRRGGRMGLMRGRIRGRGVRGGRQQILGRLNVQQRGKRVVRGQVARGGVTGMAGRGGVRGQGVTRGRGRGRGGTTRQPKVLPSKEELDLQLDQYMSNTKSALDKELDEYMKNAMEME